MKKHALFTGDGRLGNQLFQAALLDALLGPGVRLTTTGMEDFLGGFDWPQIDIHNRRDSHEHQSAKRWYRRLGRIAARLRLVSGISQPRQRFNVGGKEYKLYGNRVNGTTGLFKNLTYVDKGYFQSAALVGAPSFRLKEKHLEAGRAFLKTLPEGPRAFVHIRRGDYAKWMIFDHSPLLDLGYFQRGMAAIKEQAPGTHFILISDDIDEVRNVLPDCEVFVGANVYEDFGIMTLCDGGIISNSTLSWWGGFFCTHKLPVISPKWFLAHGLGFEYPVGITAPWMTAIDA